MLSYQVGVRTFHRMICTVRQQLFSGGSQQRGKVSVQFVQGGFRGECVEG